MSFIIILSICCSILKSFLSYVRILFGYKFLHRFLKVFLVQKRCPKSTQNDPKIDPSASQGWLHLASFGHTFFVIFDAKMAPKMTSKYANRPPNGAQDHQNVALSSKRSLWGHLLDALGRIPMHCLLAVWILFKLFRRIGVGRGGEGAHFSRSHHSSSKPSFSTKTSDWHGADLLCNLDNTHRVHIKHRKINLMHMIHII